MDGQANQLTTTTTAQCWTPRTQPLFPCQLCSFSSLSQKGVTIHLRKAHHIHLNPPRCKSLKSQRPRRSQSQLQLPSVTSLFSSGALNGTHMHFQATSHIGAIESNQLFGQHHRPVLPTEMDMTAPHFNGNSRLAPVGQLSTNAGLMESTDFARGSLEFPRVSLAQSMSENASSPSQSNEPYYDARTFGQCRRTPAQEVSNVTPYDESFFQSSGSSNQNVTASSAYYPVSTMDQSQSSTPTASSLLPPDQSVIGPRSWDRPGNGADNRWNWHSLLCEACGYQADDRAGMIRHLEVGHGGDTGVALSTWTHFRYPYEHLQIPAPPKRLRSERSSHNCHDQAQGSEMIKVEPQDYSVAISSAGPVYQPEEPLTSRFEQQQQQPLLQNAPDSSWHGYTPHPYTCDTSNTTSTCEISSVRSEGFGRHRDEANVFNGDAAVQHHETEDFFMEQDVQGESNRNSNHELNNRTLRGRYQSRNINCGSKRITPQIMEQLHPAAATVQNGYPRRPNRGVFSDESCELEQGQQQQQQHQQQQQQQQQQEPGSSTNEAGQVVNYTNEDTLLSTADPQEPTRDPVSASCYGSPSRQELSAVNECRELNTTALVAAEASLCRASGTPQIEIISVSTTGLRDHSATPMNPAVAEVREKHNDANANDEEPHRQDGCDRKRLDRIVIVDREMIAGAVQLESAAHELCASLGVSVANANGGIFQLELPPAEVLRAIGRSTDSSVVGAGVVRLVNGGNEPNSELLLEYTFPNGQKVSLRALRVVKATDDVNVNQHEEIAQKNQHPGEAQHLDNKKITSVTALTGSSDLSDDDNDEGPLTINEEGPDSPTHANDLEHIDSSVPTVGLTGGGGEFGADLHSDRICFERIPHQETGLCTDPFDFCCDDELFVRLPRLFPDLFEGALENDGVDGTFAGGGGVFWDAS